MMKVLSLNSNREAGKSMLLNKLAVQNKFIESFDSREYRLVTGSDDGHIFFWNIPYDLVNESKNWHANERLQSPKKVGKIDSSHHRSSFRIPEIKPKYELMLSGYA